MKYIYILSLLFILSSCQDKERELLLRTQNEYIVDLLKEQKMFVQALEMRYFEGKLRLDSPEVLNNFNSYFSTLLNTPNQKNEKEYKLSKTLLFEANSYFKSELKNFNEVVNLSTSEDSIFNNNFKINLLKRHNDVLEFLINSTTVISCFGPPEYRVYYGNDYFLDNKKLFRKGYFNLISNNNQSIDEIFIGKLDSSFNKENISLSFLSYSSQDPNNLRMKEVIESHKKNDKGYIDIDKFSDKCFGKSFIEGIARSEINTDFYVFVPFRIELIK